MINHGLPLKWQRLFAAIQQELQQASPTPMSREMQHFLQFMHTHREQFEKLAACGADLDFVAHVLYVLVGFPRRRVQTALRRWLPSRKDQQALQEGQQKLRGIELLERTIEDNTFPALSPELRADIHAERSKLRSLSEGFTACMASLYHAVETSDPLTILLAPTQLARRERGRPSAEVPTLFMVLLTDHLQERTGRPRYREIGLVTSHLFPGSISAAVVTNREALWKDVKDRCKKFRKTHDISALRAALFATTTPFLEEPWAQ
jgi:hypothetical protein